MRKKGKASLSQRLGVLLRGERMEIYHHVVAVVLLLERVPVRNSANIIPECEVAARGAPAHKILLLAAGVKGCLFLGVCFRHRKFLTQNGRSGKKRTPDRGGSGAGTWEIRGGGGNLISSRSLKFQI